MVFNATFNKVVWWQSVLLVEETGLPGENNNKWVDQRKT